MPLKVLVVPKQALGGRSGYGLVQEGSKLISITQCGYISNMIFVTWMNKKDIENWNMFLICYFIFCLFC